MIIIGIETATERLSASILIENEQILERHKDSHSSHCELLTGFILELVNEANITMDEIDCVAVSVGPGSFTGLRIGIATAMGLAYGLGIPACGINTLMGLAWNSVEHGKLICPVIDAKRSEVYTALYRTGDDIPQTVIEPMTLPVSKLAGILLDKNEKVIITGPAAEKFRDMLHESLGKSASFIPPDLAQPSALSIAELGLIHYRLNRSIHPGTLKPVYLRRSDAEIARDSSDSCNRP